jgi:chorismate mutase
MDPTIQELRDEIAAIDRAILADINTRIELVARIRSYKTENGIPFVDPDRERQLLEALDTANGGPLSPEGVRELFTFVLDLAKRELET